MHGAGASGGHEAEEGHEGQPRMEAGGVAARKNADVDLPINSDVVVVS